jgi:hypothetical protein
MTQDLRSETPEKQIILSLSPREAAMLLGTFAKYRPILMTATPEIRTLVSKLKTQLSVSIHHINVKEDNESIS